MAAFCKDLLEISCLGDKDYSAVKFRDVMVNYFEINCEQFLINSMGDSGTICEKI